VEIENQGTYVTLAPKQTLTYTVTYKLVKVPAGVTIGVGSSKLAAMAGSMYKQ